MNYTALFQAIGLCLISVLIETAGTTKSGRIWFENLKMPRFSLSFKVWYFVGGLYYIICGIIAYRIFAGSGTEFWPQITALSLMMLMNGAGNFLLFRLRSLKWFYLSLFPFTIVLLALYILLLQTDIFSSWVLMPYIIWLIYDFYYLHALWNLNRADPAAI